MRVVSWNINGLPTTFKEATSKYGSVGNFFSNILRADVLCLQEAKVAEERLERAWALVDGYDSYWAFSRDKKGYSGCVTFVRDSLTPLDAVADAIGPNGRAWEGAMGTETEQGTEHGRFVLLNVYVPNAGERKHGRPRLRRKMAFLRALRRECDAIRASGQHVVVVGDLNISHRDIDVFHQWRVNHIYCAAELQWLDSLFALPGSPYRDLFRYLHPTTAGAFTVWDQRTDARSRNEGQRIDYAVCDAAFLPHVLSCDIIKVSPKQWSDHAAIDLVLVDSSPLPPHPRPSLSARNMSKFQEDSSQRKLTAMFGARRVKGRGEREGREGKGEEEEGNKGRGEREDGERRDRKEGGKVVKDAGRISRRGDDMGKGRDEACARAGGERLEERVFGEQGAGRLGERGSEGSEGEGAASVGMARRAVEASVAAARVAVGGIGESGVQGGGERGMEDGSEKERAGGGESTGGADEGGSGDVGEGRGGDGDGDGCSDSGKGDGGGMQHGAVVDQSSTKQQAGQEKGREDHEGESGEEGQGAGGKAGDDGSSARAATHSQIITSATVAAAAETTPVAVLTAAAAATGPPAAAGNGRKRSSSSVAVAQGRDDVAKRGGRGGRKAATSAAAGGRSGGQRLITQFVKRW
ncbi:hypothetical protein CLOM_g12985 [Closterium sp. NIES-68]|nr:hypothetical protein CLOM_g12985 [Closterium sp. NIES-68]GJP74589.1 hypothetical protein CLOP_g5149 [Closterium sp. NIES-67]